MQIVYLSIRPKLLAETLVYVDHLMPFIDEAIIITRKALINDFKIGGRLKLTVLDEEALLGDQLSAFQQSDDHVTKKLAVALFTSHTASTKRRIYFIR